MLVDGRLAKPSEQLKVGANVDVKPIEDTKAHRLEPANIPVEVLFEDDHLMVVNKPEGLSTHPSETSSAPTLVEALLGRGASLSSGSGVFRPGIVHRLDKGTSGLLLVAKTDSVHRKLQVAIQRRLVKRTYVAVVWGWPSRDEFTVRCHIGRSPKNRKKMAVVHESAPDARLAISHAVVQSRTALRGQKVSRLLVDLETGRTHQIRVHLASIGLPIVGDEAYGRLDPELKRMALHAFRLSFTHPITERPMQFEAAEPHWGLE